MTSKNFHVAIIMDGNGRWANSRSMARLKGHHAGAERVREIVEIAPEAGITHLTLFAFSTENWKRSPLEVSSLMELLKRFIHSETASLVENNVRVRFIGRRDRLSAALQDLTTGLEHQTEGNSGLNLTIAVDYGGRDELVRAAKEFAIAALRDGSLIDSLNEERFADFLDTDGLPDPDLVIRTSGEQRISNFLPYQAVYSEYIFTDEPWPDFTKQVLYRALETYHQRDRRYGAVKNK